MAGMNQDVAIAARTWHVALGLVTYSALFMFGVMAVIAQAVYCHIIRILRTALVCGSVLPLAACSQIEGFDASEAEKSVYRILVEASHKDKDGKEVREYVSSGSGFLISGVNLVATNSHVVKLPAEYRDLKIFIGYLKDGKIELSPAVVRRERAWPDLAILEADKALPGTPLVLSEAQFLKFDSQDVKALGYPGAADFGVGTAMFVPNKTDGRISKMTNFAKKIDGIEISAAFLQHQAPIAPGSSGGPLFDACGVVIGINTLKNKEEQGFGGAIYSAELAQMLRLMGITPAVTTQYCYRQQVIGYMPFISFGLAGLLAITAIVIASRRGGPQPAGGGRLPTFGMLTRSGQKAQQRPTTASSSSQKTERTSRHGAGDGSAGRGSGAAQGAGTASTGQDMGSLKFVPVSGTARSIGIGLDRLQRGPILIGRDADRCDIVVPNNSVSKSHARISKGGADYVSLEDLGSGNGTFMGREKITSAVLRDGDEVRFGEVAYRVELRPSGSRSEASSRRTGPAGGPEAAAPPGSLSLTGRTTDGAAIRLTLAAKRDPATGKPVEKTWSIGRNAELADLVVADNSISSVHAKLRLSPDGRLEIADNGSSNGTKVDGRTISQSFVAVGKGAKIALGKVELAVS